MTSELFFNSHPDFYYQIGFGSGAIFPADALFSLRLDYQNNRDRRYLAHTLETPYLPQKSDVHNRSTAHDFLPLTHD